VTQQVIAIARCFLGSNATEMR